jgi:hypothetical protein
MNSPLRLLDEFPKWAINYNLILSNMQGDAGQYQRNPGYCTSFANQQVQPHLHFERSCSFVPVKFKFKLPGLGAGVELKVPMAGACKVKQDNLGR